MVGALGAIPSVWLTIFVMYARFSNSELEIAEHCSSIG